MGKRSRRRQAHEKHPAAPEHDYTDSEGNVLTLRGVLTAGSRSKYAQTLQAGSGIAAQTSEDAWQRAVELLFERLASRWVIAGVQSTGQRELLTRFRASSAEERRWIREVLREHCAEHFPTFRRPEPRPAARSAVQARTLGVTDRQEPRGRRAELELDRLPGLSADLQPPAVFSHRDHDSMLEAAAEVADPRGSANAGERRVGPSTARC